VYKQNFHATIAVQCTMAETAELKAVEQNLNLSPGHTALVQLSFWVTKCRHYQHWRSGDSKLL